MARNLFGGSAADVAEDIDGSRVPGAQGTVWDGPGAEATRLTDLLDYSGNPTDTLTANTQGMIDHFYGPDNVGLLYVDFGAGRVALTPVNTSSALAQHLNTADPHGSKAGALEEVNAQKGAPGGIATLDPAGKVPSSQLPALSGDSSGGSHWLNVKNNPYGAKGDGVADDTTAILTAIEDAVYGDVIYFPPGVYVVSQPIDLYKRGITLRGSHSNLMVGPGMAGSEWACYLQAAPTFTTGAMITVTGDDDGDHPAINGEHRIESLMLDGSKVPTGSLDGIYAKGNVQNVVLRDVCVRQMPNNGIITASNSKDEWPYSWRLHSVMVDNCHTNGIVMERNTDLTLDDCQVIGSWSSGFKLSNCANTIASNCRAEWNGNYGFHIFGGWGNWPGSGSMTMTGCSTDRNGWDGVRIDASGNGPFVVQGLQTRRDGRNGGPGGGGYAGLRLSNQAPVVVTGLGCYVGTDDGGTANTSPQYGVRISGARDVQLESAYLHGLEAGLSDDGTNTRITLGTNITTVSGNNFAEDRVVVNPYRSLLGVRYVAASNAPASEKARAHFVCDGTADDVEIQAALNALSALGGGEVHLSAGTFNTAAQIVLEGTDNVDVESDIALIGAGQRATTLNVASGLVSGLHLTKCIRARLENFGVTIRGTSHGISSASTHSATSGHRSFWHSAFRNLQINGPYNGTHTGWGMHLGSPFRSVFENIEMGGIGNGLRMFSENNAFNPGDCQVTRMFIDSSGSNRVAYQVESTTASGVMNQIEFSMCEAINSGTGSTGILLSGVGPVSHTHWRGINLEQFDKLIDVQRGHGNTFRLNYVELRGAAGLTGINFGANAYNNAVLSLGAFYAGTACALYTDTNTSIPNQPNRIENVRIYADGVSVTGTPNPSGTTIRRGIVGSGSTGISVLVPHGANAPNSIPTLTDAATVTPDASLASYFRWTLAGNRTLNAPTNGADGQRITWELTASGADRTLTLGTGFVFGSSVTALTPIVTGKTDVLSAVYHAPSAKWRVVEYAKGF